jgi:hypothetical protein
VGWSEALAQCSAPVASVSVIPAASASNSCLAAVTAHICGWLADQLQVAFLPGADQAGSGALMAGNA